MLIRRSLSVIDGVARLLGTKTSRSRRLKIGASVVDALERQRVEQEAARLRSNTAVISERLGHATIATTVDIHAHLMPAMDREAAATLDAAIRDGGNQS